MHGYGMVGVGWFAVVLLWLIGLAALFGIIYAAVRLAALHALKAHTRWLDTGRPGGAPQSYPGAQQPYPGAPQPYPGYPDNRPGHPHGQPMQPGYPAPPSYPGQPYPGYPGGQQYGAAQPTQPGTPTQPTTPLPEPGIDEPPGRPQP